VHQVTTGHRQFAHLLLCSSLLLLLQQRTQMLLVQLPRHTHSLLLQCDTLLGLLQQQQVQLSFLGGLQPAATAAAARTTCQQQHVRKPQTLIRL
jgi:hypothetical protein